MIGSVRTTIHECRNGILPVPKWGGIKACAAGHGEAALNFFEPPRAMGPYRLRVRLTWDFVAPNPPRLPRLIDLPWWLFSNLNDQIID